MQHKAVQHLLFKEGRMNTENPTQSPLLGIFARGQRWGLAQGLRFCDLSDVTAQSKELSQAPGNDLTFSGSCVQYVGLRLHLWPAAACEATGQTLLTGMCYGEPTD